jgi:glycosyltransferase involved in cell wall biosynthesis
MNTPRRLRILVVLPFPPNIKGSHGGTRATATMLAGIVNRHDVAVLYLRGPDDRPGDPELLARCALAEEVPRRADEPRTRLERLRRRARTVAAGVAGRPAWASRWWTPQLKTRLRQVAQEWQPDVVQFDFHVMAGYLDALRGLNVQTVLVQHDPGAASVEDRLRLHPAGGVRGILQQLDLYAWKRFERNLLGAVDATIVFTADDLAALRRLRPDARLVQVPLAFRLRARELDPVGSDPPALLFVGSFIHPPNVDAAMRLAIGIYPRVRAERPDARLLLVGDQPPPNLTALSRDGARVTGWVPNITPYLEEAAVVVLPVRLGGGMRVKTLEALGAGKALVASNRAIAGLDLPPGTHVHAETDAEFADAVLRLLDDPAERARLGGAARAWALEHIDPDAPARAYDALYRSLVERG